MMRRCLLLIMAGRRVRAVAVIRLRHFLLSAAFTKITPLHPKHLHTRDDQNGQRGENAFAEEGHGQR